MDNKAWRRVRKEAERQGWTIVPTRNGGMLRSPDGTWQYAMDRLHRSSDPHALELIVREMRKHGFRWKG